MAEHGTSLHNQGTPDVMAVIALVSCVKAKQDTSAPAAQLYTSDWFRKARSYTQQHADAWYILSAKHHLVAPDEIIEPYDEALHDKYAPARRAWARRVLDALRLKVEPQDTLLILAGKMYRQYLIEPVETWDIHVEIPMEGMGIGQQKAWLKKQLAEESRKR